jgi:hypothetical protein
MAITAQAVVERIQRKLGSGWKDPSVDTFLAGNRDIEVKGIVTTAQYLCGHGTSAHLRGIIITPLRSRVRDGFYSFEGI